MKRSSVTLLGVLTAGFVLVMASGCSDDDTSVAAGGSGGTAGVSGKGGGGAGGAHAGSGGGVAVAGEGGVGGEAGFGGGDLGGAPSMAGEGGTSGSSEAGSGGEAGAVAVLPCGPTFSKPTVAADIAVSSTAVLVAAYAAVGTQTYTCQVTVATTTTYAWSAASVPAATLYGQSCMQAATHYAGPHWAANDGSIILGAKVRSVASATAASIPQLLLSAAVDGGVTGLLTPVTAVQRLDTVGGIAPTDGCDAAHVNGTASVPYTANYYFYSGASTIPPT